MNAMKVTKIFTLSLIAWLFMMIKDRRKINTELFSNILVKITNENILINIDVFWFGIKILLQNVYLKISQFEISFVICCQHLCIYLLSKEIWIQSNSETCNNSEITHRSNTIHLVWNEEDPIILIFCRFLILIPC